MKKLVLKDINPGVISSEYNIVDKVKLFENCLIEISENKINLKSETFSFSSHLKKIEEDLFSISYQGVFDDGIKFRIVRPTEFAQSLSPVESFSLASLHPNGYSFHFELYQEVPELQKLAENASSYFESNPQLSKKILIEMYNCYLNEPQKLWNCNNLYKISQCFSMILEWRLVNEINTIQQVASIGFLICNKAIENDPSNKTLISLTKLFIVRNGRMGLLHTITNCFNMNSNQFSFMSTLSPFRGKEIIMAIEFSILQDNPTLYNKLPVFAKIKKELDDKIVEGFFNPAKTKEEVNAKGRESDSKLYSYLVDKVIKNQDIFF